MKFEWRLKHDYGSKLSLTSSGACACLMLILLLLACPAIAEDANTAKQNMTKQMFAKQVAVKPTTTDQSQKKQNDVKNTSDAKQGASNELNEQAQATYKLGVGEMISIMTFDEPDLSISNVRVGRSGNVNFPLIGKIQVLDKRVEALEKEVESMLRDGYLKKPKVTVKIEKYRDFYVNGQVNRPGAYAYTPGLTIRKAIAISGGLTDRASTGKIQLKKEFGLAEFSVSNIDRVMGPGDVLTIGESLF